MRSILPASTAEILITQKCNLNCTYCFEKCKSHKNINLDEVIKYLTKDNQFDALPVNNFFIFGGEPFMNPEAFEKLITFIDNNQTFSDKEKQKYINAITSGVITNGTLIEKRLDLIKKYNLQLQVSLDGPEDINDLCRVDYAGHGHYKEIMHNLEICRKNNIQYCIHGVIAKENYRNFERIHKWVLEQHLKSNINGHKENLSETFYRNYAQIVMEDDPTDKDIDELLIQMYRTVDMILHDPILNEYSLEERKEIAEGLLNRRGGRCAAGLYMYSYDNDFNIFPCHRLNTAADKSRKNKLMNLRENDKPNYLLYLQFIDVIKKNYLYGPYHDNDIVGNSPDYFVHWCPSTNFDCSGSAAEEPAKHNVLIAELQRFLPVLADHFGLNINNPKFKKRK